MFTSSLLKLKPVASLCLPLLLTPVLLSLGLTGCSTMDDPTVMDPQEQITNSIPRITIGDTVTITLSGIADNIAPYEKPITDDGTITMPDIGRFQAAGRTPGQLEDYIHDQYVPRFYTHLNVTVKTSNDNRVYFVRGEVKSPGRLVYVGPITVTKAITSAGDFTDFANHTKITLIRASGKRYHLNCNRILEGKDPDPPVYPGDQIEVKRRIL